MNRWLSPISHNMAGMVTKFRMEQDHLVRERTQPDRKMILDHVAQRRINKSVPDKSEALGRPALTIPEMDYWELLRKNPDLDPQVSDTATQNKSWRKFCNDSASRIYRNFDKV